MSDALATLKKARGGKSGYLYDLPWYVHHLGPPGAGKTTALVRSGLKFPPREGRTPEAVAGLGGTRYCDWWFTEDAVLNRHGRPLTPRRIPPPKATDRVGSLSSTCSVARVPISQLMASLVAISIEDMLTGGDEGARKPRLRGARAPD